MGQQSYLGKCSVDVELPWRLSALRAWPSPSHSRTSVTVDGALVVAGLLMRFFPAQSRTFELEQHKWDGSMTN